MKKLTDISSLIQLLDDPDELVYSHVKIQIMSIGEGAFPNLEEAWESNLFGVLFQNRIEELIHEIQFDAVAKSLNEWAHAKGASLLDGVMIINRYQYPDFDQEKMLKTLEQIQQDIWLELNTNLTAFEQVKVINHILFQIYGFSGNTLDYHSPKNSFLSEVLETKKGNPLSLSLIYSIISQNLDLPIYGVNLPHHFILAYLDRFSLYKTNNIFETDVLFYVNPFSKGTVFSKKEIDYFLEQLKLDPEDSFFKPATNVSIIRRALSNLENSYTKLGNDDRVKEIKHLISQLED